MQQLRIDFERAVERYDATRSRLDEVRKQMVTTRLQVSRLRQSVASHQKQAVRYARRLYEGGPSTALELVL